MAAAKNSSATATSDHSAAIETDSLKGVAQSCSDEAFDQPDHSPGGRPAQRPGGNMNGVQFGTLSTHELQASYLHDFFRTSIRSVPEVRTRQSLILAGTAARRRLQRVTCGGSSRPIRQSPEKNRFQKGWHTGTSLEPVLFMRLRWDVLAYLAGGISSFAPRRATLCLVFP